MPNEPSSSSNRNPSTGKPASTASPQRSRLYVTKETTAAPSAYTSPPKQRLPAPDNQARPRQQRPVATPYRATDDYRTQMQRFVWRGPTGWFHATAHKVELIIKPALAAIAFVLNLGFLAMWSLLQFGGQWAPPASRVRLRRLEQPNLHAEHPLPMSVFLAAIVLLIAMVASASDQSNQAAFPVADHPRSFSSMPERSLVWQVSNPFAAIGSVLGYGQTVLSNWRPWDMLRGTQQSSTLPVSPPGNYELRAAPSLTAEQINRVLESYNSPAVGTGHIWYNIGLQYGIDPAIAIAFFIHESSAGTNPNWAGIKPGGGTTHNVGNIICAGYSRCHGRFRDYASWEEGINDWYRLIDIEYIQGRGHRTIADVIPVYAPAFENNVQGYINAVTRMIDDWRVNGAP